MEFRIASTFQDSLTKLTGQEQKAAKTAAFDLQLNPAQPSLQFHRIEKAKDPNFWSIRVSRDIRIIVHKTDAALLLCYVDHHDASYRWAMRRKIDRHPRTGAAQIVEIRERVEEIPIYKTVEVEVQVDVPVAAPKKLFIHLSEDDLLNYGIPEEWLIDVLEADEAGLYKLAEHLPEEAAEALLELATGGTPAIPEPLPATADPFEHPDALRRFRVFDNVEALERALEYPWEKWTVFLHPDQQHLVERDYSGPARVSGSAGTGKTVVALHRAVYLARQHRDARIVVATFSKALANALNLKLMRLIGNEPRVREHIEIHAMIELAEDLFTPRFGKPNLVDAATLQTLLAQAAETVPEANFTPLFLLTEWTEVVDAWQLDSWEAYRDVPRLGRKTRIGGKQRERLWTIFAQVQERLAQANQHTWPIIYRRVTESLIADGRQPFDFAIVDEAQDLGVAELRFLSAFGDVRPDTLFFAGDLGQRIFQTPFSWKSLEVDIRGRSHTLNINYRTSHQIRRQADQLLPNSIADVDGNVEDRRQTISIFNGPIPEIKIYADEAQEAAEVAAWIIARRADGIAPEEIGVFVRGRDQLPRAARTIQQAGEQAAELDDKIMPAAGSIPFSTMHLAKGLEFRAVAVIACDDEVIPQQARIESVSDMSDLEEVYTTERHLLYVACTRAREHLLAAGVDPASEFLDDLELN
ncbi:MAG: mRNA-degrading endonuclease RelE of RelBE toxin-antitoxin system [Candidatus Promineifilaceae bacterium]|jgi:mRNA-degrading endonuclease RelE of RelBE toxin-antitoxin system